MTDMYILLTGGHTGIGLGVTKKLLQPGNRIGLIIRNEARRQQVMSNFDDFPQELVKEIDFFYADLSDQAQVRAVAAKISEAWPRVDRMFHNAAIVKPGRNQSKQGNELHFEINALAPYLLTTGLKPLLLNSADPKVITTVTGGMHSRKLRTDQILNEDYGRSMMLYAQSKQAVMLLLNNLADEMSPVKFVAVNPGPNKTEMSTGAETPFFIKMIARFFFHEAEVGSQRVYNAGFDQRFSAENRAFITDDKVLPIKHAMTTAQKEALLAGIRS